MKPFNLHNLTVILPGKLAVMSRPGLYGGLEEDLIFLRRQGVGAIVSLTDTPLPAEAVRRGEFECLHEPVVDFTAPSPEQLERILDFIARQAEGTAGRMVLVHCGAGLGRSGTVAAAYLVRCGWDPRQAIERIRELRPYSIETREQEQAVIDYAERLRGQVN